MSSGRRAITSNYKRRFLLWEDAAKDIALARQLVDRLSARAAFAGRMVDRTYSRLDEKQKTKIKLWLKRRAT
jgi:hypothetical protein